MRARHLAMTLMMILAAIVLSTGATAQDWPQWRGPNRDAKAAGFTAPATWPTQLTQKWQVEIGDGVATPALVENKLYVFTRQDDNEVLRCLDAATGEEIWREQYEAAGVSGPASGFSGPRSSPTVVDGKVVTLGVQGVLCCRDAATGKQLWCISDYKGQVPRFATSSSPIVVDGLCIAQLGAGSDGSVAAYDLNTGEQKWKCAADSPAYASPILIMVSGTPMIITPTEQNMVAVGVADGKLLWKVPYAQGRYNAATPIVNGQTLIYAANGTTADTVTLQGDELTAEPLWKNSDNSVQFSTPVLKEGLLFGLSTVDNVFCINAATGETLWTAPLTASAGGEEKPPADQGRRGRRGRSRGGYGSVVDAGTALFALTPAGSLVVFEPSDKEFKELARYKVAEAGTYAYPIVAGAGLFIKDANALTMWAFE